MKPSSKALVVGLAALVAPAHATPAAAQLQTRVTHIGQNDVFHIGVAISDRPEGPFVPRESLIRGSYSIEARR